MSRRRAGERRWLGLGRVVGGLLLLSGFSEVSVESGRSDVGVNMHS